MSLFSRDSEDDIKDAIEFFNSLPDERKSFIIANLLDLEDDEVDQLLPLLVSTRNALSNHPTDSIANKLYELGMEKRYAKLFVENMIEQAPTPEYELKEIDRMNDSDFKEKFPRLMEKIWTERIPPRELTDSENITDSQLWAIVHLSGHFMNGLASSRISPSRIDKICRDVGLSTEKIATMLNVFNDSLELWRKREVFSKTQDTLGTIMEMREENRLILSSIQEILKILRKNANPGNPSHFQ